MSVRYIGSKARIVEAILDVIGDPVKESVLVDGFTGTGVVAEHAALRGWPVRLNDHLVCATTMAAARVTHHADVEFSSLGGYEQALAYLNETHHVEGFIWREYSPASSRHGDTERRYFTESNAGRIDGMRAQIASWQSQKRINEAETRLLVADLLGAVNACANIAGTYGCFLSSWSPIALRPILVTSRALLTRRVPVEVYTGDVLDLPIASTDVAYFDPPYTKRQYAAYYHVLETIAVGDKPVVSGVTGLRPWKDKASDYCYKTRALTTIIDLLATVNAERIILSYSSEGHVPLDELLEGLEPFGDSEVHRLGLIGRYRPNQAASNTAAAVSEYLIEFRKTRQASLAAVA